METFLIMVETEDLNALILWYSTPLGPETEFWRSSDGVIHVWAAPDGE